MLEINAENNCVILKGRIGSELDFNHKVYGEGFYYFILEVERLSESSDKIPVTISERLLSDINMKKGDYVEIQGQFRSYNNYTSEGNKLILTVFVRSISIINDLEKIKNPNQIILNGYVCKKPIYRTTPFGREISDILLAVNRSYNKSDYIPCISWGRNARFTDNLDVGDNIKVWGRIQSRDYQKKLSTGETITKTAYEVSVAKLEVLAKKEESNIE